MTEQKNNTREIAPILVSVIEAHHALGIGRTSLYAEIKAGRIRPVKAGRRTLIPMQELQEWPKRLGMM